MMAASTITVGSQIHGARVTHTFDGSFMKTRIGVGADSNATMRMLSSSAAPSVFQANTSRGEKRRAPARARQRSLSRH